MLRFVLALFLGLMLIDAALADFLPVAFDASFVQEKHSSVSKNVDTTNLDIKYEFPGNFYLKEANNNTVYVCNADKVWYYTPPFIEGEPGLLKTGESSKYCYSEIFDTLKHGLKSNKKYTVSKMVDGGYEIDFTPKSRNKLGLSKLEISFKGKKELFMHIKELSLYYIGDKHPTKLKFKNFKVVKKFASEVFLFTPPENTEIQRMK